MVNSFQPMKFSLPGTKAFGKLKSLQFPGGAAKAIMKKNKQIINTSILNK